MAVAYETGSSDTPILTSRDDACKAHGSQSRRRCAFSMLELTVVLFVIGVLAAMAAPRYANFVAERHVEAAANRIAIDLAFAQRLARFSSTAQRINFNPAANTYVLVGVQDPDHPARAYAVRLADEPYEATLVSAELGGDDRVVFDGYGMPDSDGTIVIRAGTRQKTITLDGQTGRVTISDSVQAPGPPPEES